MRIQSFPRLLRSVTESTPPPLDAARPVPEGWCYQCSAPSARCRGVVTSRPHHDRPVRPTTLARTAERVAERTLLDADMPEPGCWDAGHVALVRAVIEELALYADVAEQVTSG